MTYATYDPIANSIVMVYSYIENKSCISTNCLYTQSLYSLFKVYWAYPFVLPYTRCLTSISFYLLILVYILLILA